MAPGAAAAATWAPGPGGVARPGIAGVRTIPREVRSKNQASTRTIGKPTLESTTTTVTVQSGRWSPWTIGSATSSTANTATAYTATAGKILRRDSSANQRRMRSNEGLRGSRSCGEADDANSEARS
jgi:hypothetical protein